MTPSLRERAGGSCDRGSVSDVEDELRQTSAEAWGSLPSSAAHSQYNQLGQASQNNPDVRGVSSEERLWEMTIEQQRCQQKEPEDEDEDKDDIEAISYSKQIKESLQHQRVENQTIVVARKRVRQHSVKPYYNENGDYVNEDDQDVDVRPPRRRKRLRTDSDATETAITRKKVNTRSFTKPRPALLEVLQFLEVHQPKRSQ